MNDRIILNNGRFKITIEENDSCHSLLDYHNCLLKRGTMIDCEQYIEYLKGL